MSDSSPERDSSAQAATGVDFALHSLGWKAFQDLCDAVAREVLGQTVEKYSDSKDGGRDGAFFGTWRRQKNEDFAGQFTIQCKFTAKRDKHITEVDLRDEKEKAAKLAGAGLADTYILMTNALLTGDAEAHLRAEFCAFPGLRHFAAYGHEWLSQTIRDSSRLRMLVPRVYGIGDLSQILDERAYAQSREILSFLGDDLARFVITDSYRKSAKALIEHGFVILLGEPACGKSTIAAALAISALDEWGCATLKVRGADGFERNWNPHEPKQFFWVDDAFGATQFDYSTAGSWNSVFPHLQAAIRRGARVVFTSRDYIYRSAIKHLKASAFPLLKESQVVIEVDRLTSSERQQILYNHLRLGRQSKQFRTRIKSHLPFVAEHPDFKPEIARRLSDPLMTKQLSIDEPSLDTFIEKPLPHLKEVIGTLDSGSRAALALVFMRNGSLRSPMDLSEGEERAAALIGGTTSEVREALESLNGSLVLKVIDTGSSYWRFKHPTIQDALAAIVADDSDLLDVYLAGTSPERLIDEVSCGVLGIQGVKVVVPTDRFGRLIERLLGSSELLQTARSRFFWFLARRCDRTFLAEFLSRCPDFLNRLFIISYLDAIPDFALVVKLHGLGLLPDSIRRQVVQRIARLAVETPDAGFLRKDGRSLFTESEFEDVLQRVRDDLCMHLTEVTESWEESYSSDEEPAAYFQPLRDALKMFRSEFARENRLKRRIGKALTRIRLIVERLESDYEPHGDDDYDADYRATAPAAVRSIFDDVDE